MQMNNKMNPGLLKLDLYCKGIRIDDSCLIEEDGGRKIMRTRAGLGSGLEVILPHGLYTNIPVVEAFAKNSPYVLYRKAGKYFIYREEEEICRITLSSQPLWYTQKTSSGKLMSTIGSLQGTYLAVYPSKVCEYWLRKPHANCKFCSVGLNLGVDDADEKSVNEVFETVLAARKESKITYVDFNTGHYPGDTYLDILDPYIRKIKKELGLLIGIQTPPHHDLTKYYHMKKIGVNRVSFCFEIFDEPRFIEVCPGKNEQYGLKRYLDAIEFCSKIFETCNGEIVAGLESPESSIKAIDWITDKGAIPTVCIFRPLIGTDYQDEPPPKTEDMIPIFQRLYHACMEKKLPIGVAPNIRVSLVMLPEECKYLAENSKKYFFLEAKYYLANRTLSALFNAGLSQTASRLVNVMNKNRKNLPADLR
ncbi:MAG: hypothetical protein A2Y62_06335 [Candidatus Fischerbacteria bacterium RBG_13_37_8]|uniref:Radical SAM core domain-containing protein n=1 Tax=Candidatus Fischerbacteria bacterium RBG_13_37_8 TaxID=1817863 RepID=A0A1F5VH61_9BACT|nr:MAG: hypothetical protein A2Y62_06335 [Candidatus Fischerbacteria bacterium RBG_13_37_8]